MTQSNFARINHPEVILDKFRAVELAIKYAENPESGIHDTKGLLALANKIYTGVCLQKRSQSISVSD